MKYSPVYFNLLNMKEFDLKITELVTGEIYKCSNGTFLKWGDKDSTNSINNSRQYWNSPGVYNNKFNFRNTTLEEKHWLNECIRLNKYISFDEAMKTYTNQHEINLIL